jgi:hypothetical protein
VLVKLSDDVAYCYEHARHCAEKAAQAGDNIAARRDFLDLEAKWLTLALSYEFSERCSRAIDELDRQNADRAIIRRVIEYVGLRFDSRAALAIGDAYNETQRKKTGPLEDQNTLAVTRQILDHALQGRRDPVD